MQFNAFTILSSIAIALLIERFEINRCFATGILVVSVFFLWIAGGWGNLQILRIFHVSAKNNRY